MNEKDNALGNERYKKMYLRMVRAALDMEKLMHEAMQECEEIFIAEPDEDKAKS